MLLAQFTQAQLLLLAGIVLLGWVFIRHSIARKRQIIRDGRQSDRTLHKLRNPASPAVPLCDSPPETQRWQVAMFDLQRELKAELDSRIAVVQSLIRHADERIAELNRLTAAVEEEARHEHDRSPS